MKASSTVQHMLHDHLAALDLMSSSRDDPAPEYVRIRIDVRYPDGTKVAVDESAGKPGSARQRRVSVGDTR